jgi:hypothetical protein
MYSLKTQNQWIITLSQQDYLPLIIESFIIDRKSPGLAQGTIFFYQKKLEYFVKYCDACSHLTGKG